MKTKNYVLYLLLNVLLLSGCTKQPAAEFTADKTEVYTNETITFTNTSTDAENYEWDFGDGNFSTEISPTHSYSKPGIYTVTLTAYSKNEKKEDNYSITITVKPQKLIIQKLVLKSFPTSNWDNYSDPDIYWRIEDDNYYYFESGKYQDLSYYDLPVTYTNGLPFSLTNIYKKYSIDFYDYDSDSNDDHMGGYWFDPRDFINNNTYPTVITFSSSSSSLEFDLYVEWK